jgi:hypothetical protein
MEDKGAGSSKWKYVFKSLAFLLGAGLVVVGVLDILGFSIEDPISIILPIYYM